SDLGRILKPGGILLSKQVGRDQTDLARRFGATNPWSENSLDFVSQKLKAQGLEILEGKEWNGKVRYHDIGAIVYALKNTPWTVPDFSVRKHLDVLHALE